MDKFDQKLINFFSYVKGDNEQMMSAIFGREKISHEIATLQGYELCIQTAKDVIDKVLPTCPYPLSPRQILTKNRGLNFELYTIRPNSKKNLQGEIWHVSKEEYEYLRNYELIECGMSEDIVAKAITERGKVVTVNTYGLVKNIDKITRVVEADYRRPEIPKKEKIESAIESRQEYLERMKEKK